MVEVAALKTSRFLKLLSICLIGFCFGCKQAIKPALPGNSATGIWDKLVAIDTANIARVSASKKLKQSKELLLQFEMSAYQKDSVYVRLLERIGLYTFKSSKDLPEAINYATLAVRASQLYSKDNSWYVTAKAYSNLANYHEREFAYSKAIAYYDTALQIARPTNEGTQIIFAARANKYNLLFYLGDYQSCIEESSLGLNDAMNFKQDQFLPRLYNQKAQALYFQSQFQQAINNADSALLYTSKLPNNLEEASALKTKALISAKQGQYDISESLFKKAIAQRASTEQSGLLADDYLDYGNFLLDWSMVANNHLTKRFDSLEPYNSSFDPGIINALMDSSRICYLHAVRYAIMAADSARLAKANVNLGRVSFHQNNLQETQVYIAKAMQEIGLENEEDFLHIPNSGKLNLVHNKDLLFVILNNKTELLLAKFKVSGRKEFLNASINLAMVTDSVITYCRHEQLGEQSKLYWRNRTREFYTNALEASYLAGNQNLAFYFLEKSRAVLLNDKLNELGASSQLPPQELAKDQELRKNIVQYQQRMDQYHPASPEYIAEQLRFLKAKENFEQFIKSLEKNYPTYYQYKYADDVPSLSSLQKYLAKNDQSFVHYFMNDTVAYILAITHSGAKLIKLKEPEFSSKRLIVFLQVCSNREKLNSNYSSFISKANFIYKQLFEILQLPKGRVIICPDNYFIPFESLATDDRGSHFLVEDFAISYIYSARYLFNTKTNATSKGNYLGIAPVSFTSYLKVPDLRESAIAAEKAAGYFKDSKLLTGKEASRQSFINNLAKYEVVNVFSHAIADSSFGEPAIYMGDSIIYLSELQLIKNIGVQLVLLSACQTNVGKNAAGEGIYSLARGLAAAGIPSVAATLWKADEESIYALSNKFDENIAKGLSKDIALQQAKIWFMHEFGKEKSLPYYWANMVVVGNSEAVQFSSHHNYYLWAGAIFVFIIGFGFYYKKRRSI